MHVKIFKKNFFGIEFLETFMHIKDVPKKFKFVRKNLSCLKENLFVN